MSSQPLLAQFLNLDLVIEPELSTSVIQDLDFGTIISNTGEVSIELGDSDMGVFSIRSFRAQWVHLSIDVPESLSSLTNDSNDIIPISINSSYNNSGNNEVENSSYMNGNSVYIPVHNGNQVLNRNANYWTQLYVYIYGSIIVGDIPNGIYEGSIVLNIEYE